MQEIEFQSLRNPWTPLEVFHTFGNYSWNSLDRPLLGLEMSSSSFSPNGNGTIYLFLSSWEGNDSQPFW